MNHFCLGLHANDELNVAGENGKVLVNINHPNKDSDIFLPEAITQTLKPHQVCPLILHCVKSVQIKFFSDLYFLVFGLNTEIYGVNLPIQSECRKIRTRKNSVFQNFSRSAPSFNWSKVENSKVSITSKISFWLIGFQTYSFKILIQMPNLVTTTRAECYWK